MGSAIGNDETGFTITIRDIYEEMRELTAEVRTLTSELKESRRTDDDHEKRIRILERWMWGLPVSILTAIAAVVTAFVR
ncbi:hypothetical protein [Nonomuraea zeae]|uniref:hypothetical protein n=1 Tax=Nonomuraea zeae TaxID=1642303 RepID=UPI00361AC24C